jgi:glutathione S-transferase
MTKRVLIGLLLSGVTFLASPLSLDAKEIPAKVSTVKNQDNSHVHRTLWGAKVSPYVRKVIVTLEEKKAPYKLEEIFPTKLLKALGQDIPESFSKVSPFGKIPAMEEIDSKGKHFGISDSDVIMNYLEKTINSTSLRPTCVKADARVSFFMKYADDSLASVTHKVVLIEKVVKAKVLKQETDETLVQKTLTEDFPPMLDYLEETLKDGRAWIADTKNMSLADISIVAHLSSLIDSGLKLEEIIGTQRPKLLAYVQKILARDSFKKALS